MGLLKAMKRPDNNIRRKNFIVKYVFEGIEICETSFLQIYSLGMKKWKIIRNNFQENGIKPIIHGNKRRRSHHALSFDTILYVITFIVNYSNIHVLPSPGKI